MQFTDMAALFDEGHRRWHLVGTKDAGVAVGLDLEGRLFTVLGGRVLNRVNPKAFLETCTAEHYLNPGGDGLWPAPEGSCLGYEYSTGSWRVPPGLTSARFIVVRAGPATALVRAEIDLINALGVGVPTAFERQIEIRPEVGGITVQVRETIEYLGDRPLARDEALLAPWTLCQFDSGPGCYVCFPDAGATAVQDLYEPSDTRRETDGCICLTRTDGGPRYQIGLSAAVEWLEFHHPDRGLVVRRGADPPPPEQAFIDIADRSPRDPPAGPPVRFSVYSDPAWFMEIEAAGGCPRTLTPGTRLELNVTTHYSLT